MDYVMKGMLFSAIRSIMIATGAYATGKGWIDDETARQVVGSLMVAVAAIWGMVEKVQADNRAKQAALAVLKAPVPSDKSSTAP